MSTDKTQINVDRRFVFETSEPIARVIETFAEVGYERWGTL